MAGQKIRVLPDDVANRIAAGEVVERPASVVKELAENAVDAGAQRVRVRVEGAGKARVVVEDDGEGMARDDALLALERHATSKLTTADDLEHIATLGFRGEAVPSIAAVSRFRLLTRTEADDAGTEVLLEGGRLAAVESRGAPRGTTVEVADLFFNVPARRKFLKADATELRNVVEIVTQLALAHHQVGFELRSGERRLLAVPPGQSLEERVGEVAGAEAPGGLHWARWGGEGWEGALAFAAPHEGRGHRKGVRLFVNGRPVQDRLLFRALLEGYRGLIETGRYPVSLLWVRVPAGEVDVNVHPAKREVRFRDEGRLFRWVAGHTAEALARGPWSRAGQREAEVPAATVRGPYDSPRAGFFPSPEARDRVARVGEALQGYARRSAGLAAEPRRFPVAPPRPGLRGGELFGPTARPNRTEPSAPGPGSRFGGLRYLGDVGATYLVFADEGGSLVILDQHAAHERVLFERLLDAAEKRGPRFQPFLLPVTLECAAAEMAAWEERAPDLASLGFQVERFGPAALAVTGAPAGLSPEAAGAVVRDLLGAEDPQPGPAAARDRLERTARRAACAAAVKARDLLDPSEVDALLAQLETLRNPTHCPHGRPLLVQLSRRDLEGLFHRG
jgi:DNA mismatch repair protein MutL